tara:strand:- start:3332 stop:3952 length:621 start_codon:yes stop_codon:yes gene_type:complete
MKFNKAAMFGLDARIALAIFGALSVISGAALYSAIQSAKIEQYRYNFEEVFKATEQYYLDNYSALPATSSGLLWASDLTTNRLSLSTWNGPYFEGSTYGGQCIKNSVTNSIHSSVYKCMYLLKSSNWAGNASPQYCVVGDSDCAISIVLNAAPDTDGEAAIANLFNMLDESIDGGDGQRDGKIKYINSSTAGSDRLVYIGYPRVRE